ncbi:MAG TPA: amidohydrolase family protein [Acidimicrobiales bacterium]|nr:amidohydrolase family protein [Acidimicrobiales bacterium]
MAYDLVIRNGTVVDGSGLGSFRADIGILGDRIASVGRLSERGTDEIDADGQVVTPGFIDGHTHMDAQVFWDATGSSSCWHGVTSAVMGNCGFTLAPVRSDQRALVVRNLERAEDMDPAALAAGIEWNFETFPQYLDAVDRLPKGINFAANIGHSALRTWAMGERAFESQATEADLAAMKGQLAESIRAGAIGFSTSRSQHHETSDNRPVASRLASWDEVAQLVGVMGELGSGIFEGADAGMSSPDPEERHRSLGRMQTLAADTQVPLTFGLVATKSSDYLLDFLDEAAAGGARVIAQTHCRGISVLLSLKTKLPFDLIPAWDDLRRLPVDQQVRVLGDREARKPYVDAAVHARYEEWTGVGAQARPPDFDGIKVYEHGLPPNPSVAAVARQRAVHPAEAMIDLCVETGGDQLFIQPSRYPQDETVLLRALRHPRAVMTFSDSGAHLSQIADSSIHTHLLGHWVRDRQEFTLEEAVRMITLAPALAWGFNDRGLVRAGMAADLNIFDPATVGPAVPRLVDDLPAGGRRLEQRSHGFLATVVNGQVTIRDGAPTGAAPGRLIRSRVPSSRG